MTATVELSSPERPVYPSLAALRLAHSKLLSSFDRNNPSPEVLHDIEEFLQAGRLTGWMLSDEERRNAAQSILDYWSAVLYRAKRPPPDSALIPFGPPVRFADVECPYPGLAPFDAQARDFFLGRQAVIDECVARLKSSRLLVVTGPRGCGKSSLIRAGLLPELQAGALPGSDRWCYVGPFVPGAQPLQSLARAVCLAQVAAGGASAATTTAAELLVDPGALTNAVRLLGPALVFVDQLEDVLPAPGESLDAERTAFVQSLVNLARAADVGCVLIATRTDEDLDTTFHFADELLAEEARADVPDFGTRELRDAIQLPAELVGVTFDEGVVPDLVRAMIGVPVALPLLQFVLAALWEKRSGQVITWDAYRALMWDTRRRRANAGWAIGHAAQERYDNLASDPAAQAALKSILLQLIVPVAGAEVLLRRLRVSQLRRGRGGTASDSQQGFDRALHELIEARLLRCSTTSEGDDPDESAVEVVHAALARNWPALDHWLVEVRIEQERRRRLQAAAKEWLDHARSEDALWREALLEGIDEHDPEIGAVEREFINQSRLSARQRERRRMRTQRLRLALALAGLGVALVVVFLAGFSLQARRETQLARSDQLLAEALRSTDPAAALLMAVSAYQINPDTDARVGLLDQLQRHRQLVGILGASGQVTATAASSDGALLAGAEIIDGDTRTDVVLWNGTTLAELRRLDMTPLGQNRRVRALAFDASHTRLAIAFDDNTISVWDTQTGQPLGWRPDPNQQQQTLLVGRQQPLSSLAFDSRDDHDWLVSIGLDGLVSWDLRNGQVVRQARVAQRPIVALSPDGTRVAATGCSPSEAGPTCSSPRVLRVWDTATAQPLWSGVTRETPSGVWFSAHGDLIALANQSGTVEVRDATEPDLVLVPQLATGPVVRLGVDSTSGLLITATCKLVVGGNCSADDEAHVQAFALRDWAPAGPPLLVTPDGVLGLALLPSTVLPGGDPQPGLHVVLPQPNGLAVLDMQVDRLAPDPMPLADSLGGLGPSVVQVGPEHVAVLGCVPAVRGTVCPVGAVHLADGRTGSSLGQNLVGEPPAPVTILAASIDGTSLASGRVDGRIEVWDPVTGALRTQLTATDSGDRVSALAFAPDGRLAAAAGQRVRLWIPDDPRAPQAIDLTSTSAQTTALAFSADSISLGSGGSDGTLQVWSIAAGAAPRTSFYRGHTPRITSIAFSPDKRLVAAAGSNKKVLLWDVESTKLIGEPLIASSLEAVASLTFSPDSRTITAGDGRSIASWRLGPSSVPEAQRRACQIAQRNLTAAEWKILQVDPPATPACPEWAS
jgi:WD40 repeat protein/energy-coupling factor transporter ATP-binding protein EcfA2